jgi:hypothetical protein
MQVGAALLTHPATVLGYVTQVAAVRRAVLAGETLKAVLINTLLPTVLHMQQANCYLPFRHTVPFQLGLFLVAVMWAHGMPCWLPVPGQVSFSNCTCVGVPELAANSSNVPAHITLQGRECEAALAFQQQGTRVCQMIDVLHMLAWSPVGCYADPVSLSTRRLCDGAAAFQLLHVFAAGLLTIVVTLASIYCVEYYCKLHWLRGKDIDVIPWRPQHERPDHGSPNADSLWWACREPAWTLRDLSPYGLLLLPFSCCWLLGQWLAAGWDGKCAPLLGMGAFTWLSQLY